MSFIFRGDDNFLAVPGLKTWLDGRYNVVSQSNLVSFVGDLSSEGNNFTQGTSERKPQTEEGKWIKFIGQSGPIVSLRSSRLNFNFLHNGSPHGVYGIVKWTWNVPVTHTFLATTGAQSTGMQFLIQQTVSNGRVSVIIRNEGVIPRTVAISNLLPTFPNEIEPLEPRVLSQVFLGANISNNQIMRLGDLEVISTDISTMSEYNTADHESFSIGAASSLTEYENLGVLLIYDWTGYTPEQVLIFDARIRALLTTTLPVFM